MRTEQAAGKLWAGITSMMTQRPNAPYGFPGLDHFSSADRIIGVYLTRRDDRRVGSWTVSVCRRLILVDLRSIRVMHVCRGWDLIMNPTGNSTCEGNYLSL